MRIVENLTNEDLLSISQTGELIYTDLEQKFLVRYSPYTFFNIPFPQGEVLMNNKNALLEINQAVFANNIAIDLPVARHTEMDYLAGVAKEKATELNKYLILFGIEEVDYMKDPLQAIAETKLKASQCLERTVKGIDFKTELRDDLSDRFPEARKKTLELYGDVPAFIFGSSLETKKPNDIDIKVVVPEFSDAVYKKIIGTSSLDKELPLNFIIIPSEYLSAWILSDSYPVFRQTHSLLINGSLEVPFPTKERFLDLQRQNSINRYMEARKTLTPNKLSLCEGIIERMNNRLKIPKFVHMCFSKVFPTYLEKPNIIRFNSLPDKETFAEAMVQTNLELEKILSSVYK